MRIYPHHQDTGGFFIAVLQRKPSTAQQAPAKMPSCVSVLHVSKLSLSNATFRETKRQANAVEGLEISDGKKPKLSGDDISATSVEDDDALDEAILDSSAVVPAPPSTEAVVNTAEGAKPEKVNGKKQKAKGGDVHFKENPYTFLKSDDPVLQTCM